MTSPPPEPTRPIGATAVRVIAIEILVIVLLWWAGAHFAA